jgi:hypothetical protein
VSPTIPVQYVSNGTLSTENITYEVHRTQFRPERCSIRTSVVSCFMTATHQIPRPPKSSCVEAHLSRVIELAKFVVSEPCNPDIKQGFGRSYVGEASMSKDNVVQAEEDRKVESLKDLQIPWHSKAANYTRQPESVRTRKQKHLKRKHKREGECGCVDVCL